MAVVFSAYQLIINSGVPNITDFQSTSGNDRYARNDSRYEISTEIVEGNYYWMYFRYGKALPYSEIVVNKDTEETKENPRDESDVELNNQLFCLYDGKTNTFYLSNSHQIGFIEEYFKERLKKDITIKHYFVNPTEFIDKIKKVKQVSLTSTHNLFSENSDMFGNPKDILGLGQPEELRLDVKYRAKPITDSFKKFFNALQGKRDNQEIQNLVCIGEDDEAVETVFNINTFIQKITINQKKDRHGFYDAMQIRAGVMEKVKHKDESDV